MLSWGRHRQSRAEGAGGRCRGVQRYSVGHGVLLNAGVALCVGEAVSAAKAAATSVLITPLALVALTKRPNAKQVLRANATTSNQAHDTSTQKVGAWKPSSKASAEEVDWRRRRELLVGHKSGLPRCGLVAQVHASHHRQTCLRAGVLAETNAHGFLNQTACASITCHVDTVLFPSGTGTTQRRNVVDFVSCWKILNISVASLRAAAKRNVQ